MTAELMTRNDALRDTLTGIQRETFTDSHGWMTRVG
jgi:hypothetical protein